MRNTLFLLMMCVLPAASCHLSLDSDSSASISCTAARCCKVCRKGKACGNSCISRDKSCHQPRGCACNR